MVTLRHITAAEERNQLKEREREIKREREKKTKGTPTEREETGISSMIGFDTATSSFLALLINNHIKTEKDKIKKVLNSAIKEIKTIFCLESSVK